VLTGGILNVSGTLSDTGTYNLAGGTLGNATVASGTTITGTNSGGTLDGVTLIGTLDLATRTGASVSVLNGRLAGGAILGGIGGTVSGTLAGTASGGTLDSVTLTGTLDLAADDGANVSVLHGLTVNGAVMVGASDGSTSGYMNFTNTQTLGGSGSVVFGASANNHLQISTAGTTVTIGSSLAVDGKSGQFLMSFVASDVWVNRGIIAADVPGGTITLAGTWTNSGTLQAQNGGILFLQNTPTNYAGSMLTGGTWQVFDNSVLRIPLDSGIVTNAAAIVLDGANSNIYQDVGTTNALALFAVNAGTGSFTIQNGRNLTTSSALSNAGNLTVGDGSTFTAGGNYIQTAGTTTLNGGTLSASTLVDIRAGTLAGTGLVNANVQNAGLLTIGDSTTLGLLTINGNFTQTSAGTLAVKIGGLTTPGTDFDQLVLSPGFQATLAGTLRVTLIDGYTPATEDSVTIMTFDSATGRFAALTGDGGLFMDTYDPTDVTLVAI
jgi:hypothetical protein